jgi:predicted exporter
MTSSTYNLRPLIVALLVTAIVLFIGLSRIQIDTDIASSLPQNDPVISDAMEIFSNHPIHDQLAIDVGLQHDDLDVLVECGEWVEEKLRNSNLFRDVGMKEVGNLIPDLIFHILENLPVMFTDRELEEKVEPLLESEEIHGKVEQIYLKLLNMEGVGQAEFIARDPLGLKDIVLGRLAHVIPSQGARIYRGHIISSDQRHLLVTANAKTSSTDTTFARKATELISNLSDELNLRFGKSEHKVTLTPVGTYRAALDNELIIRGDVKIAILLATTGIALLLIFAFPRPLVGLLCLLPAIAGTIVAFFVYSLLHESISIVVLGFGGAVVSITVDHSIVYLLFLDRPHETRGREASKEAWAVGQLAVITTIGAFAALCLSGFPILEQLGQFTALAVLFSFVFVHCVFPLVFPVMPQGSPRALPLQNMVNRFAMAGKKGAWVAVVFAVAMLFFAKPEFSVSLSSMNTVSKDTTTAERQFSEVWGSMANKVFLMTEGESVMDLQNKGDRLLEMVDQDILSGSVSSAFVPSMVFPGKERREQNLAAWMEFWDRDRVAELKAALGKASLPLGFAADAFEPFYKTLYLTSDQIGEMDIPEKYFSLLGISRKPERSTWLQFSSLTVDKCYDAEGLFGKYRSLCKVFDPAFFSERLGSLLFTTFEKMLVVVGSSVVVFLFLFFLDWRLTLISLAPVLFAFISTLGTLKLIGHPLDIPGLMLSVVVLGMGIDYSLFFVRSYQRYGDASHPSFGLVRMAVFMASASTIIGFGVLCSAQHMLLRSAGLTSLLGIGYCLIGTFLILPPVLEKLFRGRKSESPFFERRSRIV